jgi:hypothetical protein
VYDVSQTLTDEQKHIAQFWADGSGTLAPPGHSASIALQLNQKENLDLASSALLLARLGIAVNDAFVSCWHAKYAFNLLRPETYVRKHIDPSWKTLIATPPFPEYTSGHSTQSAAAAVVLSQTFGEQHAFTDDTHLGRADLAVSSRSFPDFETAAREAAQSRLYGGTHCPMGNDRGFAMGTAVGREVMNKVKPQVRNRGPLCV